MPPFLTRIGFFRKCIHFLQIGAKEKVFSPSLGRKQGTANLCLDPLFDDYMMYYSLMCITETQCNLPKKAINIIPENIIWLKNTKKLRNILSIKHDTIIHFFACSNLEFKRLGHKYYFLKCKPSWRSIIKDVWLHNYELA